MYEGALDDAPVRGLRQRRGDERALPLPARSGPDRALDCVRHADADGLRLGPPAVGGRGRSRRLAIDSLEDMETLFGGIPLGEVSTSMTINSPAAILLAFYVCVGEEQGVPRSAGGTIQTDILKEYIAQKEWIFPPEPSMRLVTDMVEYCTREMPLWHPISISGYHIREAGSTRPGARLHARRRLHVRRVGDRARARRRRLRAAALASSSTRTSTSSRRSRSTAPRAGSGRASCATATGK